MPLYFIKHNGFNYPSHQSIGGASLWIRPLAQHYCIGKGLDIGYSKEAWMLPNAVGIEPSIDPQWDAMKLPNPVGGGLWDFLHSSHCLEHVNRNIYDVLDYWLSKIKVGGIMFLYLPHSSQSYWHPSSNRKHVHKLDESEIETYLNDLGHKVYVSGVDWNHSFVVICEKVDMGEDMSKQLSEQVLKSLVNMADNAVQSYPDANGDVYIKGCFDKSIKDGAKFHIENHIPTGHYPVKDSLLNTFTGDTKPYQGVFERSTRERKELGLPVESYADFIKKMGL